MSIRQRFRAAARFRAGRKQCNKCEAWKVRDEFYKDRSRTDGRVQSCKACIAAYVKAGGRTKARTKAYRRRYPRRKLLVEAKHRAKKQGRDFDLTLEDIVIPDTCPVLGIPLRVGDGRWTNNSPTLDRIDNAKGYVRGNVAVISWRANNVKGDAAFAELLKLVRYLEALHA